MERPSEDIDEGIDEGTDFRCPGATRDANGMARRAPGWFFGKWGSNADHASSDNHDNERDTPSGLLRQRKPLESICIATFDRLIGFGPPAASGGD